MPTSAGILMHRERGGVREVLLIHHGGPFWAKRDLGAWSIPKGGVEKGESPIEAARREFREETGFEPPPELTELATIRQRGGKTVICFTGAGDADPAALRSIESRIEHPRGSGRVLVFPEIDRGAWFSLSEARRHVLGAQVALIDALERGGRP